MTDDDSTQRVPGRQSEPSLLLQQGDVLFFLVLTLPAGALETARGKGMVVRHGEQTGHAHMVAEEHAALYTLDEVLYLVTGQPVTVCHQEHDPITLLPGVYRIGAVLEVDYALLEHREQREVLRTTRQRRPRRSKSPQPNTTTGQPQHLPKAAAHLIYLASIRRTEVKVRAERERVAWEQLQAERERIARERLQTEQKRVADTRNLMAGIWRNHQD